MIDLFIVHFLPGVDGCLFIAGDLLSVPAHYSTVWLDSSEYHSLAHCRHYVTWTQR